jgi:YD repeat-containing protein
VLLAFAAANIAFINFTLQKKQMINHFFATGFAFLLCLQHTGAQYYHKDIISVKQAIEEKNALQQRSIRNILVHSFEADGTASEGFYCEKKISRDFRKIETTTRSAGTTESLLTSWYNDKGQLTRSSDSSAITAATTLYEYDEKGNIFRITSYTHSSDDDFITSLKEIHQYSYNENNQPVKMLKIKNDRDSSLVDFLYDEKGNLTDEIEPGKNGRHYYYYYDDKNRLTDIVKYNVVKGGLRADFIFEYNSAGQVTQMISVEEGLSGDYLTWKYIYNEGLRIIEKCFSRDKKLLGYFEYEYD